MTIDVTYFGSGVGLVLLGYTCGAILGLCRDALTAMRG